MFVAIVFSLSLSMSVDAKYQELTHVMDMETMMFHPFFADEIYQFKYTLGHNGSFGKIKFVSWNMYSTVEHMGTHFDAPYHYSPTGRKTEEIPLDDLHGPLVRIDISEKAKTNSTAKVELADLQNWEKKYGQIPGRAFILMDSGWRHRWGNQTAYVGTDSMEEASKMAWPGFDIDAAKWLLENRSKFLGLGVDTVSCDVPSTTDVHVAIQPADKFCIENLNNLDKVPEHGAEFFFMPLLIKGGTGGQIRSYAFWDTDMGKNGAIGWQANIPLLLTFLTYFHL